MATFYNAQNITLAALLDYFFELLPEDEEVVMEAFFDEHQDYADLIEEIGAYCLDHHISSPEDYFEHFKDKEQAFLERYNLSGIKRDTKEAGSGEVDRSKKTGKSSYGKPIFAVLILLLVLMALLWFFTKSKTGSSEQAPAQEKNGAVYAQEIYDEDFFNISMQLMGDNAKIVDSTAYYLGRIEQKDSLKTREAIAYFTQMPNTASAYQLRAYYLGHAYFVLGEYPDAATSFEEAFQLLKEETREKDRAAFLAALSYLAAGKEAQAVQRFSNIASNENHSANAAAKSILNQLNAQ